MRDVQRSIAVFESVRALPYDLTAAVDADGLRAWRRGNCVAKASLLAEELEAIGLRCRLVSWEYALPVLTAAQRELAFSTDIHTTVQVQLEGRWSTVDATHDPALARLGLAVGTWDGRTSTVSAFPALGPVVPRGADGGLGTLNSAAERIAQQVADTPPDQVRQYQEELGRVFEGARRSEPT